MPVGVCQLARHSWGRLSAGGKRGRHCANLPEHVCIYLSRTACRCDATPVKAVPTCPDVRASTRPAPMSTGGSVCRVEHPRSCMVQVHSSGGLSRGGTAGRRCASSPEYACSYTRLFYAWDAISITTMAAGPVSHGNAQVLDPWRREAWPTRFQPALLFM